MPSSLYDRFKVGARASHAGLYGLIREVSELVSRIEVAQQHGADSAPLEHQKSAEAKSILLDPHVGVDMMLILNAQRSLAE